MIRGDENPYDAAVEQLALYNMTRHDAGQPPLDYECVAKDVTIKQYSLTKQREANIEAARQPSPLYNPVFTVAYGGPK